MNTTKKLKITKDPNDGRQCRGAQTALAEHSSGRTETANNINNNMKVMLIKN